MRARLSVLSADRITRSFETGISAVPGIGARGAILDPQRGHPTPEDCNQYRLSLVSAGRLVALCVRDVPEDVPRDPVCTS